MPGKIADFLRTTELERAELDHGVTVRHGPGYTLRLSAALAVPSGSSPAANRVTVPRVSRWYRHSSRPAVSTRTA
ncbi:hypothetical protein [Streptomyces sp. IBSBF 3136]|uniref:hypothetical protein n=1 Tax=Streptomyces sp. IBSBF 3136 TaxID=2903524 RepID=UPI002FDC70D5